MQLHISPLPPTKNVRTPAHASKILTTPGTGAIQAALEAVPSIVRLKLSRFGYSHPRTCLLYSAIERMRCTQTIYIYIPLQTGMLAVASSPRSTWVKVWWWVPRPVRGVSALACDARANTSAPWSLGNPVDRLNDC